MNCPFHLLLWFLTTVGRMGMEEQGKEEEEEEQGKAARGRMLAKTEDK